MPVAFSGEADADTCDQAGAAHGFSANVATEAGLNPPV
jgi:hypothetical protein